VKRIRILLVDDHTLVRAGIRALLERMPEFEVVGEGGNGEEGIALVRREQPDLVLLDLMMPGLDGQEVLAKIREEFPLMKVIVLSIHDTEEFAAKAMLAGANGYVPKKAASTELNTAIRKVMNGEEFVSPEVSGKTPFNKVVSGEHLRIELTPRQHAVLKMIAEGQSTKQIARALDISVKTVETHRALLMDRLNIHDVTGLVRYAIRMGIITIEE
jgi:DNA-binding NarL/FixJ family response regulator